MGRLVLPRRFVLKRGHLLCKQPAGLPPGANGAGINPYANSGGGRAQARDVEAPKPVKMPLQPVLLNNSTDDDDEDGVTLWGMHLTNQMAVGVVGG